MQFTTSTVKLQELNVEQCEAFLKKTSTTLLYTSLPYLKMLKSILNCDIEIIISYVENELVGFFPIAFKTDEKYGTVCNSLPFYGSNGGMIVSPELNHTLIREALLEEFERIVKSKNCIAYTIISNPLDTEGDSWLKQNVRYDLLDERIGQITHFPSVVGDDVRIQLMNTFDDPRPRNIRRAQNKGVTVKVLRTQESLDFLYNTHYDNITAINGIAKKKQFFTSVPQYFKNDEYKVYVAELDGKKIAALLLFYYNKTVEYFTPAVVEEFRNIQPTSYIIYEAMLDAIKAGYEKWNWGGTWHSQGGVYDFKKKWGTNDHKYFYYSKINEDFIYRMREEELLIKFQYFFVLPFYALKNDH